MLIVLAVAMMKLLLLRDSCKRNNVDSIPFDFCFFKLYLTNSAITREKEK